MIIVTGGAGFIGSNFIHNWIATEKTAVVNLDKLTYAGNLNNLADLVHNSLHHFVQGDIGNRELVHALLQKYRPSAIINFAAETHVDRSIRNPNNFVQTNIINSFALLDEAFNYWKELSSEEQASFRFLNISTDEVFGSLSPEALSTQEESPYHPNSPYSATKASFDHLVHAYQETYGFPTLTTYSSNNFGPFQFPEKIIPLMIVNALQGKPLPIYGDGNQIRNWIYVVDHCEALKLVLAKGKPGSRYNIGDTKETVNLDLVHSVCRLLDEIKPDNPVTPHRQLIKHVKDRPGHDRRYSLDSSKIRNELGWSLKYDFETNLRTTIHWYLDHLSWLENVINGEYRAWVTTHYA